MPSTLLNLPPDTTTSSMQIVELAATYAVQVSAAAGYAANLLRTARRFGVYGISQVRQLTADAVNKALQTMPVTPQTRHNIRRELLTLWKFAYESQLTDTPPLRLHRIKVKARPVEAWSMGMLERLLGAAGKDDTPVSRRWPQVTRAMVLPAWIGLGYDTGLRFADIHELTIKSFRNNCVAVSANKTGKVTIRPVSDDTADEVGRLFKHSPDGTLFKWALPRRRAFVLWQTFLAEHKVAGSSKFLRRSCATYVHKKTPGRASDYLSHSDPKLIWRHYLDQTLLDMPEGPQPIRRAR
jgi:integrase